MAKKFDIQQFLLEKGEYVGLYAAAGIGGLLLLLGLFWPGSGLLGKGAGANAADLKKANDGGRSRIRTATFDESLLPVPKDAASKLLAEAELKPGSADNFRTWTAFFAAPPQDDSKRRGPEVLAPDEFAVAVTQAQIKKYMFLDNPRRVMVIRGKTDAGAAGEAGRFARLAGQIGGRGAGGAGGYGSGAMTGPMGGGGVQGVGGRGAAGFGAPSPDGGGGGPFSGGGGPKVSSEWVPVEKLEKLKDGKLADSIEPLRIGIVAASFPYRKQVEQFKIKLRYPSNEAVISDGLMQFEEPLIERQEIGRDGKIIADWKRLDLDNTLKPLVLLSGERYEMDDVRYDPILFDGLVMGRPEQFQPDRYPKIEKDLKNIEKTLAELEKAAKGQEVARPRPFSSTSGIRLFSPRGGAGANMAGGDPDGGGAVVGSPDGGAGAGRPLPGSGGGRPLPGVGGSGMPRGGSGAPIPAGGPMGGGAAGAEGYSGPQWVVPEYCLVRFLDVTVEPGKIYRYRIKIRMANPNFGRPDVAWPALANDKDITAPQWTVVEQPVVVPPELHYYAVDQKVIDSRERERGKPAHKYLYPLNPRGGQVVLQAHRWLPLVYPNPDDRIRGYAVGDWAVAERLLVYRGESLAQPVKVEVPVWDFQNETFVLAAGKSGSSQKVVQVTFAPENLVNEPLLIDFESSISFVQKAAEDEKARPKRIDEDIAPELVILTPDGKLLVRDGVTDSADTNRRERVEAYRKRIEDVKAPKVVPMGGDGGNPFGGAGANPGGS